MIFDPKWAPYFAAAAVLLFALVVVAVAAYWLARRRLLERDALYVEQQQRLNELQNLEISHVTLRAEHDALTLRLSEHHSSIAELTQKLDSERSLKHCAQQQASVIAAQLEEREQSFQKQVAQFNEQKQALTKEFELLAHKIFEEKGKNFEQQSKNQMDAVLKPFKEQIDGFQKRVNDVHTQSVQGNSKLEAQIKNVLDIGLKMSDEADSLARALKGDKKAQGNWSEVQAELLLEMAGLSEGREYEREANFKTDDGRDQRPDFIIHLPNDKHIIVDSKISLNAYVQSCAAETEEAQQLHLKAHVEAIRQHVKSLSDKNYAKLKGLNSLEYIFMFVGSEPAYLAAANHDPALFQDAYRKGIAIVTPNTLLSSLRIVSHLWSIDKQNNNTRQLAEQASKVYDKLRVFAEKMQRLGAQISTVQKTYDESWSTLKDGRGSLAKQVDKFVDMGVSVKEKLPSAVTDKDSLIEPKG